MEHKVLKEIENSNILPQIPEALGQLLSMLLSPIEFNIDASIKLLRDFKGLEENIIKVLNFNSKFNREIDSLDEAVNYLGANNLKIILVSFVTRLLLPNKKGRARSFDSKKYWKHCLGTSVAGTKIAKHTGLFDESKLFTYGLIHDIGITVLDICLPDKLAQINEKHLSGLHQLIAEKVVLGGLTHADIGMWICEKWGLPKAICEVVGYHHTPFTNSTKNEEVIMVHLADSISTHYYENLMGLKSDFVYSERSRKELTISKEFIESLVKEMPNEINKAERFSDFFF